MEHLLSAEGVLENVRGRGEGLLDIAAPQSKIERDVGALAAFEMLEIGEGAGGLQFIMHQNLVIGRFDFVKHCRQLYTLRYNRIHALVGDVRIESQHDRNRLADKM